MKALIGGNAATHVVDVTCNAVACGSERGKERREGARERGRREGNDVGLSGHGGREGMTRERESKGRGNGNQASRNGGEIKNKLKALN